MSADLDELAGPHEQWCQERMHGDCCAGDCDCGRDERRDAIAAALTDAELHGYREAVSDCRNICTRPGGCIS